MAELRITEREAIAIGALVMSVGSVVANGLYIVGVRPRKRCEEVENLLETFTKDEIDYVRSFIPDAKATQ